MQILSDRTIEKIRAGHRKVVANTRTALAEQLIDAGDFAVAYVHKYPGFRPRTGKLQNATEWRTVRTSNGRILKVRNTAKYAAAIDQGARPHIIRARRAGSLHFVSGGKHVFRKSVNHPGNRPYKFLYKATTAAGRAFQHGMGAQMNRIARSF